MTDLTMSILDGPLEQTCGLENENLNCSQITVWAVENGRFELGRSSGTDLGLEDENSDVLDVLTATELDSDVKTDVFDVKTDVFDADFDSMHLTLF